MAEQTVTTTPSPTSEGLAPFAIPGVEESCSTFYKVYGDINSSTATPLIAVHGGPGAGHNYMLHFSRLWTEYNIPVIFYDQIGCGKSSLVKEKAGDASFWVEGLFIRELDNLVDHLGLRERGYDVFGHSWGGMLGPAYAATRPRGLGKLVAAHGGASKETIDEAHRALAEHMPSPHREVFLEGFLAENPQEREGFQKAEEVFFCVLSRVDSVEELPKELPELIEIATKSTSSEVMWSETKRTGTLEGWTVVDRLHLIQVPVMIISAKYDHTAQDVSQKPFFELIPKVRWYHLEDAGHAPWLETEAQREKYFKVVAEFLAPFKTK